MLDQFRQFVKFKPPFLYSKQQMCNYLYDLPAFRTWKRWSFLSLDEFFQALFTECVGAGQLFGFSELLQAERAVGQARHLLQQDNTTFKNNLYFTLISKPIHISLVSQSVSQSVSQQLCGWMGGFLGLLVELDHGPPPKKNGGQVTLVLGLPSSNILWRASPTLCQIISRIILVCL